MAKDKVSSSGSATKTDKADDPKDKTGNNADIVSTAGGGAVVGAAQSNNAEVIALRMALMEAEHITTLGKMVAESGKAQQDTMKNI